MSFNKFTDAERRIQDQLDIGSEEIEQLKEKMEQLRVALTITNSNTKDMMEMYGNIKSFLKIMSLLEGFLVSLTKIALGLGVILVAWKYGVMEAIRESKGK